MEYIFIWCIRIYFMLEQYKLYKNGNINNESNNRVAIRVKIRRIIRFLHIEQPPTITTPYIGKKLQSGKNVFEIMEVCGMIDYV